MLFSYLEFVWWPVEDLVMESINCVLEEFVVCTCYEKSVRECGINNQPPRTLHSLELKLFDIQPSHAPCSPMDAGFRHNVPDSQLCS